MAISDTWKMENPDLKRPGRLASFKGQRGGIAQEDPVSITRQSERDSTDIAKILERIERVNGGNPAMALPGLIKENPKYADFTTMGEFREAMEIVTHAEEQFMALDGKTRKEFDNDPMKFLAFVHDPKNAEKMAELDLLTPEAKQRVLDAKEARLIAESAAKRAAAKGAGTPPSPATAAAGQVAPTPNGVEQGAPRHAGS